ncbi:DUF4190 domain-containing protein [Schumannella sp. 10F1B-5-1]|uniref:DUF4190 domain-containing protein n=1 Tax=Schumannella sp. 10F1B-5-1 TaxID=2590780 RepID=UPI001C63BBF3|nr:DUF4190 domain-containing protein [Schumannella sp. 10F1B-5-1]
MNGGETAHACTHCGRELDAAWKFCVWCGARVIPEERAEAMRAAAAAAAGDAGGRHHAHDEPIERHVNPAAIFALVLGILLSPLAVIFGHLALSQTARTGDRGRMPALIGTVLGYSALVLVVIVVIAWVQLRALL